MPGMTLRKSGRMDVELSSTEYKALEMGDSVLVEITPERRAKLRDKNLQSLVIRPHRKPSRATCG